MELSFEPWQLRTPCVRLWFASTAPIIRFWWTHIRTRVHTYAHTHTHRNLIHMDVQCTRRSTGHHHLFTYTCTCMRHTHTHQCMHTRKGQTHTNLQKIHTMPYFFFLIFQLQWIPYAFSVTEVQADDCDDAHWIMGFYDSVWYTNWYAQPP